MGGTVGSGKKNKDGPERAGRTGAKARSPDSGDGKAPPAKSSSNNRRGGHKTSPGTGGHDSKASRPSGSRSKKMSPKLHPDLGPAPAREPADTQALKDKLARLAQARTRIKTLKRSLERNFYEIGAILEDLHEHEVHRAKGYGSFDTFMQREIELNTELGLRLCRVVRAFRPDAAQHAGLERTTAALASLEGQEGDLEAPNGPAAPRAPHLPPHKR